MFDGDEPTPSPQSVLVRIDDSYIKKPVGFLFHVENLQLSETVFAYNPEPNGGRTGLPGVGHGTFNRQRRACEVTWQQE